MEVRHGHIILSVDRELTQLQKSSVQGLVEILDEAFENEDNTASFLKAILIGALIILKHTPQL